MATAEQTRTPNLPPINGGDTFANRVATNCRALLEAHSIPVAKLAEKIGLGRPSTYRLVNGASDEAAGANLQRLAKAFGVDMAALLAPPKVKPRGGKR